MALVNPERLADPWTRWLDHAVDYADDVADGLIHPKDVPARPRIVPIPPKPDAEAMSKDTYLAMRADYEAALEAHAHVPALAKELAKAREQGKSREKWRAWESRQPGYKAASQEDA